MWHWSSWERQGKREKVVKRLDEFEFCGEDFIHCYLESSHLAAKDRLPCNSPCFSGSVPMRTIYYNSAFFDNLWDICTLWSRLYVFPSLSTFRSLENTINWKQEIKICIARVFKNTLLSSKEIYGFECSSHLYVAGSFRQDDLWSCSSVLIFLTNNPDSYSISWYHLWR